MKNKRKFKGKLKLSRMFQNLKQGDKVAIVRVTSEKFAFPKRFQGKTGQITSKKGKSYIVKIKDYRQEKLLTIKPQHLKKLK